jgi:hypothetical protein
MKPHQVVAKLTLALAPTDNPAQLVEDQAELEAWIVSMQARGATLVGPGGRPVEIEIKAARKTADDAPLADSGFISPPEDGWDVSKALAAAGHPVAGGGE